MQHKIIFYLVLILSINFKAEINVEPGELFAIKLSDCPKLTKEDELFIEHNNTEYVILPASYTTKDIRLNQYCTSVRINKKNFGESRITIQDTSKVNLNKNDSDRAYKESLLIKEALRSYSRELKPSINFINPVDGLISSRYGKQRFINDQPRSPHLALDIAAPNGTKIVAPSAGKVVLIGDFFYSGNFLILDHGYGLLTSYSHMSKIHVKKNEYIQQGELIGEVGATGRVTGPHLHWSVYVSGERVNPELIIQDNFLENLFNSF